MQAGNRVIAKIEVIDYLLYDELLTKDGTDGVATHPTLPTFRRNHVAQYELQSERNHAENDIVAKIIPFLAWKIRS